MVNILIADQSYIVASGLAELLSSIKEVSDVQITTEGEECINLIDSYKPHLIFINTSLLANDYEDFKQRLSKDVIVRYLFYTALPDDVPDNQFSIMQSKATIMDKMQSLVEEVSKSNTQDDQTEELSPREKSILKCVALGLTNKEIGEKEFISTHTVISHRKNITRKLGIKTVSGLTVYAIINNIIHMNDIK